MPLFGSFSVGRWFGFPIRIDYSWFVLVALIIWVFSTVEFPRHLPGYGDAAYFAMGAAAALFFFLSLLLHELAHSIVARSRGVQVRGITLFIFGGVAQTTTEPRRPVDEFLLTVVGPLASFALAGLFLLLGVLTEKSGVLAPAGQVSRYLGLLNLVLAVFNLVPGFPLDGGRIFRAAAWQATGDLQRATRWATMGGRAFGYALMAAGVLSAMWGPLISGLWLAFIGWFLASAASSSYRQFLMMRAISDVSVTRLLRPTPAVPAELSAEKLAGLYVSGAPSALPVLRDGRLVGVVTLDDVAGVAPERRVDLSAADLMREIAQMPVVGPEATLDEVVARLQTKEADRVVVAEDGRLHGVLTLQEVGDWAARAGKLGLDEAGKLGLDEAGKRGLDEAGRQFHASSAARVDRDTADG